MIRQTIGLTENTLVISKEKKKQLVARIDTGATKSSIDKSLADEMILGPIIRTKVVKQASGKVIRDVIKVKVKIANKQITSEFTVADRSHMKYRILIGQNTLKKGKFLIDPLKKLND